MLNKSSDWGGVGGDDFRETPIGTAIANGAGLFANDIQNARDALESEYGGLVGSAKLSIANLGGGTLGMSDGNKVYLSEDYVSNLNMTEAMVQAGKSGFHPKIGNKTGVEAVTAHELGHHIAGQIERKTGISQEEIVARAGKALKIRKESVACNISEYARYNYHETIAESFADVYCNGSKASKASIAVVNEVRRLIR